MSFISLETPNTKFLPSSLPVCGIPSPDPSVLPQPFKETKTCDVFPPIPITTNTLRNLSPDIIPPGQYPYCSRTESPTEILSDCVDVWCDVCIAILKKYRANLTLFNNSGTSASIRKILASNMLILIAQFRSVYDDRFILHDLSMFCYQYDILCSVKYSSSVPFGIDPKDLIVSFESIKNYRPILADPIESASNIAEQMWVIYSGLELFHIQKVLHLDSSIYRRSYNLPSAPTNLPRMDAYDADV